MRAPPLDRRVLDALQRASSLELFQLRSAIDRMLDDPMRILAIRKALHVGQTVRFSDGRDGRMRAGKVAKMTETRVTVVADAPRELWTVPYAAIEPPQVATPDAPAVPEPPAAPRPSRHDFRCGLVVYGNSPYTTPPKGTPR